MVLGRAVIPQVPGIEEVPYLTNSSIMDVDFLPRHLIIMGGGYIGLEFAQMYRRFGSEVTIIKRSSHLTQHEDEDVSAAIREILEHEGINVRLNATRIGFSRWGEDILAHVDCANGDREVSGAHLLLAVGRRPNTMTWGLLARALL
jgi:pyruvate/2-oxoglutarate dehydrogenase complex dihydrolipoamide dehydrogenase (E3) component